MPFELKLDRRPAGYSVKGARHGELCPVIVQEFTSSEDGDLFISRLEGFPFGTDRAPTACEGVLKRLIDGHIKAKSPSRFLTLSSHDFSGGSGDGSDDPCDTGEQEGNASPIGVLPEESIPETCPQPGGDQGHADDSCNHFHEHATPVRGQSMRTG
jgi:hypothetical protein